MNNTNNNYSKVRGFNYFDNPVIYPLSCSPTHFVSNDFYIIAVRMGFMEEQKLEISYC